MESNTDYRVRWSLIPIMGCLGLTISGLLLIMRSAEGEQQDINTALSINPDDANNAVQVTLGSSWVRCESNTARNLCVLHGIKGEARIIWDDLDNEMICSRGDADIVYYGRPGEGGRTCNHELDELVKMQPIGARALLAPGIEVWIHRTLEAVEVYSAKEGARIELPLSDGDSVRAKLIEVPTDTKTHEAAPVIVDLTIPRKNLKRFSWGIVCPCNTPPVLAVVPSPSPEVVASPQPPSPAVLGSRPVKLNSDQGAILKLLETIAAPCTQAPGEGLRVLKALPAVSIDGASVSGNLRGFPQEMDVAGLAGTKSTGQMGDLFSELDTFENYLCTFAPTLLHPPVATTRSGMLEVGLADSEGGEYFPVRSTCRETSVGTSCTIAGSGDGAASPALRLDLVMQGDAAAVSAVFLDWGYETLPDFDE